VAACANNTLLIPVFDGLAGAPAYNALINEYAGVLSGQTGTCQYVSCTDICFGHPPTAAPTALPTSTESKAPTPAPKFALAITFAARRALAASLNATQIAAIEVYLANLLGNFTGTPVAVDSLSQIGTSAQYLVIYHFTGASAASAQPISATQAATLSTQIASDPANTFGISALAVATTGSPSAAPTPKPSHSASTGLVVGWAIHGVLALAAWRVVG